VWSHEAIQSAHKVNTAGSRYLPGAVDNTFAGNRLRVRLTKLGTLKNQRILASEEVSEACSALRLSRTCTPLRAGLLRSPCVTHDESTNAVRHSRRPRSHRWRDPCFPMSRIAGAFRVDRLPGVLQARFAAANGQLQGTRSPQRVVTVEPGAAETGGHRRFGRESCPRARLPRS